MIVVVVRVEAAAAVLLLPAGASDFDGGGGPSCTIFSVSTRFCVWGGTHKHLGNNNSNFSNNSNIPLSYFSVLSPSLRCTYLHLELQVRRLPVDGGGGSLQLIIRLLSLSLSPLPSWLGDLFPYLCVCT